MRFTGYFQIVFNLLLCLFSFSFDKKTAKCLQFGPSQLAWLVLLDISDPGSGSLARPGGTVILAVIITNAYWIYSALANCVFAVCFVLLLVCFCLLINVFCCAAAQKHKQIIFHAMHKFIIHSTNIFRKHVCNLGADLSLSI